MQNGTQLAAVDLGSNSFRLEIGNYDHGQIHRSEYLKETVRQGSGLDDDRNLTQDAMQRGWDCLARFGERLANFTPLQVRAVATQTLREARNRHVFLERGSQILGFPIEVISGQEEARLIYQGVSHLLAQSDEKRLVIDIGGRSTELVLGQQFEATEMSSYRVGSVAWSMKYFPNGKISEKLLVEAEIAAKAILEESVNRFKSTHWNVAYGSSGTIGAVFDILKAGGRSDSTINNEGLHWLREKLIKAQHADRLKLEGLKEDRRAVLAGGVSILNALFELLNIRTLVPADGALRHGVLYDLLERENGQTDLRNASISRLAKNFKIDQAQAERVSLTAQFLFSQIESVQKSSTHEIGKDFKFLTWAAQLHEIGCLISHSDYHKHGAYILDNADVSGFAATESHKLSMLVLGHHGKLKKLELELDTPNFSSLLLCLRLAVIFCHARIDVDISKFELNVSKNETRQFELSFPLTWSYEYPQSMHLLREEATSWKKVNWMLILKSV